MQRERSTFWTLLVAAAVFVTGHTPAFAAEPEGEEDPDPATRLRLRLGSTEPGFVFDGILDDAAWQAAPDSIANLITIEPVEGGTPAGRTIVKVLANADGIVIGARCYDDAPVVSFSKARDFDFTLEDHLVVVLDTFQDDRSGYVFAVNPTGARFDGLVVDRGEEVNGDWDTIWEAKTSTDGSGWSTEIWIPIKSLSFQKSLDAWGFNIQRRVQRLQETSRWSGANLDIEIFQASHSGLLTELPEFDLGLGLSIRPAAVGRAIKSARYADTEYDGELSLDVTQRLGPTFLSALTVNTDFAETEVDVRQINLTRFPAFFPEKRTFFLEGADIFQFGLGLDEESFLPFFSRRIGLYGNGEEDQVAIPIQVGGKITGRVEDTSLGALVVNTRKEDRLVVGDEGQTARVPQATMGAVRVKQDILEESAMGMLLTFGDQQGRDQSITGGMDFTFQTSSFMDEKNLLFGAWGLFSDRIGLGGDKTAYGFELAYPNDLLDIKLTSIHLGDGFQPSLGFIPRNDTHLWKVGGEFNPRPPVASIHQMFHEALFVLYNDQRNDRWQSYTLTLTPLDWLFQSGDRITATAELEGDRPPQEFEIADNVDMPRGSYEWTKYVFGARSADKRRVSAEVIFETGNFYNGELETVLGRLTVKPSALLSVELTGEKSTGTVFSPDDGSIELFERSFSEELYGLQLQLNISPEMQFSSLTQYDTKSRTAGSNNRFRWTFDPNGDLFVVYNHNAFRNSRDRWEFESNQIPVKIQYAWRF